MDEKALKNDVMSYQEFFTKRNVKGKTEEFYLEDIPVKFVMKTMSTSTFTDCNKRAGNDHIKLCEEICIRSLVEPDFSDIKFLEQLEVTTPNEALKKSLLLGEIIEISEKAMKFNGFNISLADKIKAVKN